MHLPHRADQASRRAPTRAVTYCRAMPKRQTDSRARSRGFACSTLPAAPVAPATPHLDNLLSRTVALAIVAAIQFWLLYESGTAK